MKRSLSALVVLLAACGPGRGEVTDLPLVVDGPVFRLEGDCNPSAVSMPFTAEIQTTSCLMGTPPPTLVETQLDFDRMTSACGLTTPTRAPTIDFSTQRALIVSSRGASEWFVMPNFVAQRGDALEVGLVIRPRGSPPPDNIIVLPRNGMSVELRWCRSVCTQFCDQPLP
ncbi:MAG: hypothetical protein JNM17_06835 [Archangium sp.]|nr:hypothetical protein [Archangium sp.]